jgi:hypothetical protein
LQCVNAQPAAQIGRRAGASALPDRLQHPVEEIHHNPAKKMQIGGFLLPGDFPRKWIGAV